MRHETVINMQPQLPPRDPVRTTESHKSLIGPTFRKNTLASMALIVVFGGSALSCLALRAPLAALCLVLAGLLIYAIMVGYVAKEVYLTYGELVYKGFRQVNHNVRNGQWKPMADIHVDVFKLDALDAAKAGKTYVTIRYEASTDTYTWSWA